MGAGTLPCLKLMEWSLTVWLVPCSTPHDRVATADCCIWPTYCSHRRGQNGLDYLLESRWPTWGGIFCKTLGHLAHSLHHGAPQSVTHQLHSQNVCRFFPCSISISFRFRLVFPDGSIISSAHVFCFFFISNRFEFRVPCLTSEMLRCQKSTYAAHAKLNKWVSVWRVIQLV